MQNWLNLNGLLFEKFLGKPPTIFLKICEQVHTSLGLPSPPPPTVSALGYSFSVTFWDNWGCLVRYETDLVKFVVKFDKNYAKKRTVQI